MDSAQLQKLVALRERWLSQFNLETTNSIAAQLCSLTWNVTGFEIVQEMVRISPDAPDGGKQVNGLVFRLFTHSFFNLLMSSVRKLVDKTKGTNSLRRLIDDMQKHHSLFTRELILASEGVAYDWTELAKHEEASHEEQRQKGMVVTYGPPYPGSADQSRHRHSQIDELCGVTETDRKPNDRVKKQLFTDLNSRIEAASEKVKDYVDKHVAHAAAEYRLTDNPVKPITLGDLHAAHHALCEVGGFLSLHVLGGAQYSFFVHPLGDPFIYLDKPLIATSNLPKLQEKMTQLEKQFHEISAWRPGPKRVIL